MVALVGAVLVAADQLTKSWAVGRLSNGRRIELVGSLHFELAYNTGTAFSVGSGRNLGPFIALLALAVVVALILVGDTTHSRVGALAVGLVAGGAIGNLLDRAFRHGGGFMSGGVVDFIALDWWPTFNVADMAISVGAVVLVLASLRPQPRITRSAIGDEE